MLTGKHLRSFLAHAVHGRAPERKPPAKARNSGPERDAAYLAWIRSLPCMTCQRPGPNEAHHCGAHGMAQKSSDYETFPLCTDCHTQAPHAYHRLGKRAWEARHGVNCAALVEALRAEWRKHENKTHLVIDRFNSSWQNLNMKTTKTTRQSVKCNLCGAKFMSELTPEATAEKHSHHCEKWLPRLADRIEYRTRNCAPGLDIAAAEQYQMRVLYMQFRSIDGHVAPQVPCDARCTGARGHNCECQCGGMHHGEQNAISAGMVAA